MTKTTNGRKRVAIVGAGLVGATEAALLAKRGFVVDLFERRDDIRKAEVVRGRSINLAMSCRGRAALRAIGIEDQIVEKGIPMYARMIHNRDGTKKAIPYGTKDEYIMSIDRRKLNEELISAAEKNPNVSVRFDHKFVSCDFDEGKLTFETGDAVGNPRKKDYSTDLIIGADGAYSKVRGQINRKTLFNFQQEFIPHGYMEVYFPPSPDGKDWIMEKNYLHIWARDTFMMIGLPNPDFSFTGTLFMPFDVFGMLTDRDAILDFFSTQFPDALPMIGPERLVEQILGSEPLSLISVKCSPYHYEDKGLIIGDAAHAMVPFYGQGMNCGMEDCLVLDEMLRSHDFDLRSSLKAFSDFRKEDAHAICDLAMYNYVEMRSHVNSSLFLARKIFDNAMHALFGERWIPLYTSVSFRRLRYSQCVFNKAWQDRLIDGAFKTIAVSFFGVNAAMAFWTMGQRAVGFRTLWQLARDFAWRAIG